jgi:hypothetical protein
LFADVSAQPIRPILKFSNNSRNFIFHLRRSCKPRIVPGPFELQGRGRKIAPETSVKIYEIPLHNIPEEQRSLIHGGWKFVISHLYQRKCLKIRFGTYGLQQNILLLFMPINKVKFLLFLGFVNNRMSFTVIIINSPRLAFCLHFVNSAHLLTIPNIY